MKRLVVAGAAMLTLLLAAGCSSSGSSSSESQDNTAPATAGGNLNIVLSADVDTLDPHDSALAYDLTPLFAIFDTLTTVNKDLTVAPGLASSWKYSTDNLTLDMTIRNGVTFTDGTPVDATAVAWNINRQVTSKTLKAKAALASVKTAVAKGMNEVELDLKQPDPALLTSLAERVGMIMSPKAAQADPNDLGSKPVGSGPFKLQSWVRGGEMKLVKNDHYWQSGKPYLNSVSIRAVTDGSQRLTELTSGSADIIDKLEPKDIKSQQGSDSLSLLSSTGFSFGYLAINVKHGAWSDARVRQALSWAIDREVIANVAYQGAAKPASGPFPPAYSQLQSALTPSPYDKRDVEKAKSLLAEAGHSDGVDLVVNTFNRALETTTLQLIQSEAKEAGIRITIRTMDSTQLIDQATSHAAEATFATWSGRIDPGVQVYNLFHTGAGSNLADYSNPQVDQLLDEGAKTNDQGERAKIYAQVQDILLQDSPWLYTVYPQETSASRKAVKGYDLSPLNNSAIVNLANVSIRK